MPRVRDCCCGLQTQNNLSWCLKLKLLHYALAFLVSGAVVVPLLLRFAGTPEIKVYVEDARLSSFALTGTRPSSVSFSAYNISISVAVALTVRNPNWAMAIKYTKPLVATFLFHDRRLYNVTVDEGHRHKPLKRERHLLHTGGDVLLDAAAVEEFKKHNTTGVFKIEMRLAGAITRGINNQRGLELSCPLNLERPRRLPGPDVVVFHEVECKPDKPKKIVF